MKAITKHPIPPGLIMRLIGSNCILFLGGNGIKSAVILFPLLGLLSAPGAQSDCSLPQAGCAVGTSEYNVGTVSAFKIAFVSQRKC